MSTVFPKVRVWLAFAMLLVAAAGVGCQGFFVDPTLSTITVTPPTPSVQEGNTQQMTATGTYDDGSTKNITSSVSWTTDDSSIATVGASGLVTGVATGSATITATSAAITGSTTVTVTLANLQSITVTPSSASISSGGTEQFTAIGTVQGGGTQDITDSVTWTSSDEDVATIAEGGLATAKTVSAVGTTQIRATSGTVVSPAVTLTVNP